MSWVTYTGGIYMVSLIHITLYRWSRADLGYILTRFVAWNMPPAESFDSTGCKMNPSGCGTDSASFSMDLAGCSMDPAGCSVESDRSSPFSRNFLVLAAAMAGASSFDGVLRTASRQDISYYTEERDIPADTRHRFQLLQGDLS